MEGFCCNGKQTGRRKKCFFSFIINGGKTVLLISLKPHVFRLKSFVHGFP